MAEAKWFVAGIRMYGREKEREDSRGTEGGGTEVDDGCGWSTATVLVHTTLDNSGLRWGQQAATAAARCSKKSMCCLRKGERKENRRRKSSWLAGPKKVGRAKSLDWNEVACISFSVIVVFFSFFFTNLFLVSVLVNDFIQHLGRVLTPFKFYLLVSIREKIYSLTQLF
jgi:hypothetical protein